MSNLTGKGWRVSMSLSPELGRSRGSVKTKCEYVPSFSQMPIFSRGKHIANKPRLGVNQSVLYL